jgi:hypothetical protein
MGLLNLFLQNKTALDVDPTPSQGNGPVGTPNGEFNTGTTPFQQVWDSNNTYINSFIGGTNTGIQPPTLSETGLDVDDLTSIPSTTTPNTLTQYPAIAKGSLNQSALQFLQIWNPVINYNDVVAGAPTSPLEQSLSETGLDVENQNAAPTTTVPTSNTVYPNLASGEFGGAPEQYTTLYNSNNTYLSNYNPNQQPNTLSKTGLDVENQNAAPTTLTPNTLTEYPQFVQGEFNGAPTQYAQIWNPTNQYIINYNPNVQPNTLNQTGLDNIDSNFVSTTTSPTTLTDYGTPSVSPSGEFGGAPEQYTALYNSNNTYLNTFNPNIQQNTILDGQTGLDNLNPNSSPTTTTPSTPTDYGIPSSPPTGEFGDAPSQYTSPYGPNNTYLSTLSTLTIEETNPQIDTLDKTGLDNLNPNSNSTTLTPNNISSPTNYGIPSPSPLIQMGKFGGAPDQYITPYTPDNTYLNALNPDIQQNTILEGLTGLDNTLAVSSPTTTNPLNTLSSLPTTPVNLPPQTFMGEFQGAPEQFTQLYTPNLNEGYLNNVEIQDPNSPQINTLSETGLDIENQNSISSTTNPLNTLQELPVTPQNLPTQTFMGSFQGAPEQFSPQYTPNQTYLDNYNTVVDDNSNTQVNTLDSTGLDTNNNSLSTTVTPAIAVATPTILPPQTYMGEFGGAPSTFTNVYSPNNGYLNNIEIQDPNSPQTNTLGETGLDNTNENHLETTSSPLPVNVPVQPQLPLNITVAMNPSGSAIQFTQKYKPSERYLDVIEDLPIGSK